jgi:hypothetical protein
MAIRGGASVTLATPRTYQTIGTYRAIGYISAKSVPDLLKAIGGSRARVTAFLQVSAVWRPQARLGMP